MPFHLPFASLWSLCMKLYVRYFSVLEVHVLLLMHLKFFIVCLPFLDIICGALHTLHYRGWCFDFQKNEGSNMTWGSTIKILQRGNTGPILKKVLLAILLVLFYGVESCFVNPVCLLIESEMYWYRSQFMFEKNKQNILLHSIAFINNFFSL